MVSTAGRDFRVSANVNTRAIMEGQNGDVAELQRKLKASQDEVKHLQDVIKDLKSKSGGKSGKQR